VPVQFLKPSEWKKLAGLKGNANKDVVLGHAQLNYNVRIDTQDAADALLIAVAGQRRNGETWERGAA
jgi:Holliday junction resolvasome RuvABC endonuclease subunit